MTATNETAICADVSRLTGLLSRQLKLFEHLGELSEQQTQYVDEGQSQDLLALLAQRQQLIDQLEKINGDLQPFRSQWDILWQRLDPSQRRTVGPLVQQAQQLLGQIMDSDDHDRDQLQEARGQISSQLGQVNQIGAARRAYAGGPAAQTAGAAARRGRFMSQEG